MKIHFNNALNPKASIVAACGIKGPYLNTTADSSLVTCKRCQNMVGFPANKEPLSRSKKTKVAA